MSLGVHNNLAMLNASRQFKINSGSKAKSAEKLSSGYRLNRSADDAAGLQISEKMRWQIRGLNRGTENAQDGISWVQTGDGALEEVHALLQRMRELTIQSLNDTNTPADRAACQAEFDALQCEVDRITKTTEFNTQRIFDEHESPYYQNEGNVNWQQSQPHIISAGKNDLVIGYRSKEADAPKTATITVPAGIYTTQELMDEIDDAIIAQGLDKEGIVLEYTHDGTCNLNLEGGEIIDSMSGGLSYLFYEMYEGGSFGALIGTTIFANEFVELEISNQNNHLEFDIEDFNGNVTPISINVPLGDYTRSELIDYLNSQLTHTDVTASAYGTGIRLEGADSIVTGFKGNMFKIDDTGAVYHSVFYDNVKYGNISMRSAYFEGGLVKPTAADQEEHQEYVIDSSNNQLIFKANGADTPVTMQIQEGSYTVGEMVAKLNDFFTQEGLELTASIIPVNASDYQGIRIDSTVKGCTSQVGLDRTSSAYDTLFVIKEYNYYGSRADVTYERTPDNPATTTGAKQLGAGNIPTISAGVNDQFKLVLDGTGYTITLDSTNKTYSSAQDIADEINAQLTNANAPVGYKDKVEATVVGNNQILLTAKNGSGIKNLSVAAEGTNTGYNDIFVRTETTYSYTAKRADGTSSNPPKLTLGESIPDKMTFDNTNNKLNINFNGQNIQVDLPVGQEMTRDEILDKINEKLPDQEVSESNVTFSAINAAGTTTQQPVSFAENGTTSVDTKNYSDTGSSQLEEGKPGAYKNNEAATITIGKVLPSSIEVTDDSNQLTVEINGVSKTLTLEKKTYTPAELVKAIQKQIDASYEQGKGADVSLDGNGRMVFTVHLKDAHGNEKNGASTTISCSTSSSLLKKLHTTETAAVATSGRNLLSDITITEDTNTFAFTYKSNGVTKTANLTLDKGTYSREAFVDQLNKQLTAGNHDVKASLSGSKLRLTTTDMGNDTSISYHSDNGGSSAESVFGPLISETAATGTARAKVQDTVSITADTNIFEITVDGQKKTVILEIDDYNPTQFKDMLNRVFEDQNVGLTASLNNGQLVYTTKEKGNDASIQMSYDGGGSSMSAIYGKQQTITPGLNASLDGNNKLVLEGTQNGGYISVTPEKDSPFLKPTASANTYGPSKTAGYSSTTPAAIDGVNISQPIKIDAYNNELNFSYYENGTPKSVSITVPDGEYYFAANGTNPSIVDYLQQEIDNQVGTGKLTVTASTSGIRIESVNVGSNYRLDNFSGDFYKKVLCKCEDRTTNLSTTVSNGTQTNDLAYTVGRKDIRNTTTIIKKDINDTLTFDFTYGNNPPVELPLKVKLDPGNYSGVALKKEIQEKLDAQLVAAGLEPGTIIADIGGVYTGVSGSNDNNALTLKLSPTVRLPAEGQYIIDGVSGNAAFSIFYQTEGEMMPAYVKGAKDISEGVTINQGETDLSFKVDGTEYILTLDAKEYTAQELLDAINAQMNATGAPVVAEMDENVLKLSYTKLGKHSITDVNGLAKDELFFNENGDKEPHEDVMIQLSSNEDDALKIQKDIINTAFLKINSVAITQPKYANKALVRLDGAIARVSEVRSTFGSEQNRLEHAIANNENTHENTQYAESRIRDADMAVEMVGNARDSILEQVSMSMQAQAKKMTEGILRLLQ